jgi:serine/threonine-protein kinase
LSLEPDPHLGREILGRFHLTRRLEVGGMASIYVADDRIQGGTVAVKILSRTFSRRKDLVSRFRREARAMSALSHPHVVQVHMYGQLEDGSVYIVMELVNGKNLARILAANRGPLPAARAIRIAIQASGALGAAHRAGLVHRDVKPENFLLTQVDGRDHIKLIDFGLARVSAREIRRGSVARLTDAGSVFGTPQFMSPEQAAGDPADGRSDQYALALILYELLTGKPPYDVRTPMDFINAHIDDAPIPLAHRGPELTFPRGLQAVLDSAFAKRPEDRYPTMEEFAAALEAVL